MTDANHEKFRELLDQNYQWPDFYTWKFIVKVDSHDRVVALLVGHEVSIKTSGKGNYVSITSRKFVATTDEVIEVYRLIATIPGVMSL
ncbi:MAG: DUF493 family protein [Bacteriovoracia bacterium]